jgi:predicted metal-dependent hydrolase
VPLPASGHDKPPGGKSHAGIAESVAKAGGAPFNGWVQLEWLLGRRKTGPAEEQWLAVGSRRVPLRLARSSRARRYILRLATDGAARVTVPRGGSVAEAHRFAASNVGWLERQLLRQALRPARPAIWQADTEILFRGERVRLSMAGNSPATSGGVIAFATETIKVADAAVDLRPTVERHLRSLAGRELPARVWELAAQHQLPVRCITIRNQRSRWGSCSRRGTISLNWRLVQTPPFVRDYLILHELAHLREMNHSHCFWGEVARLCPGYPTAERWLKQHAGLLA